MKQDNSDGYILKKTLRQKSRVIFSWLGIVVIGISVILGARYFFNLMIRKELWESHMRISIATAVLGYYGVYDQWPTSLDEMISKMDKDIGKSLEQEIRMQEISMSIKSPKNALNFKSIVYIKSVNVRFDINVSGSNKDRCKKMAGIYYREVLKEIEGSSPKRK